MPLTASLRPQMVAKVAAPIGSGREIDGWLLTERLGGGQWSDVFRARPASQASDSPGDYALKLARTTGRDAALARRLIRREAIVGREVSHPHLVPILAANVKRDQTYAVLPYLDGASLEEVLQVAPRLPPPRAFWIARQIASALAALHAAGWCHADVKPANIHVSPLGHATLLDLGLAVRTDSREAESPRGFVGTMHYAAPEKISAVGEIGSAGDVYSLGVALFQMLTGRLPFSGETWQDFADAHQFFSPPDTRELLPELPAALHELLQRSLAKRPAARPSAAEFAEMLIGLEIVSLSGSLSETPHSQPLSPQSRGERRVRGSILNIAR